VRGLDVRWRWRPFEGVVVVVVLPEGVEGAVLVAAGQAGHQLSQAAVAQVDFGGGGRAHQGEGSLFVVSGFLEILVIGTTNSGTTTTRVGQST
jgi:hypothetical protein